MNSTLSGQSRDQFLKDNPLVIRIADGPYQGQDIAISSEKCLIRGQHHNRAQCAIFRGPHRTILQDLAGNTRLNGIDIKESSLQVGDSIHCGDLTLRVENLFKKMNDATLSLGADPLSVTPTNSKSAADYGTSTIAKEEGSKPHIGIRDEVSSASRDQLERSASKPQTEVRTEPGGSKINLPASPIQADDSLSHFLKLHRQLVGHIGICRQDLVQFGKELNGYHVELATIQDSSARQYQPVIAQVNRQSAQFNQLIKALHHLRKETSRQIDNRLQHFDPAWVKHIADWKNRANQLQQGIAAQVSSLQKRLVDLSRKCQADHLQLESFGQAEDLHARIDAIKQMTESSIVDSSQILDRVDGLTDSMEQMSTLIKQQAHQFDDFDLRLAGIDETIADLDGSTTERLESARQQFEQYADHSLEPVHRQLQSLDDRTNDLTGNSAKQTDQLNQLEQRQSESLENARDASAKIEHLSQKISEINSLQQQFDELDFDRHCENWNQQLERLNGEFEQNKNEVCERLGSISGLEEKANHQHQSIDQLNQCQTKFKTELADWQAKSDQLADSLGQLQEQVQQQSSATSERVSNHENWLHEIQNWKNESADRESGRYERMEELSNHFDQFRHQYHEHKDSFEQRLHSYQESFDSFKNSRESEEQQAKVWDHCEKLQESINQLSDQYREHLNDAHSLQERLHVQEQWAEQIQQAGMVSVEDFEQIKNNLATTNQRVDSFSELADRYAEIDSQLDEFRSLQEVRTEKTLQRVDQQRDAFEELRESTVSHQEIHRLQDLFDRLEEKLEASVLEAIDAGDLKQLQGFTKELRSDVDQLKTAFDESHDQQEIQDRLDQFELKIASIEKESPTNGEWDSRFAELHEQIPDLKNRLQSQADTYEDQQKQFQDWTTEHNQKSEKSEECLVELSCKVDDFKSRIEEFQKQLQSVEDQRNQNEPGREFSSEQSEILDQRFAEWTNEQKQKNEKSEESFDELSSQVDDFKSKIENVQERIQSIEDSREQKDESALAKPFADQLEVLSQTVTQLKTDMVTGFKSELTDANEEFRAQRDEVKSFGERYQLGQQALNEQISELRSQLDEQPEWTQLKHEFGDILKRFEILENQFQAQPENESAIENESDVTEEMSRFEHRLDATNQRIDQFEKLGQQFQQLQSDFSNWKSSNSAPTEPPVENELQPAIETNPDDQDDPLVAPGFEDQEPRNTTDDKSSDVDETTAEFMRVIQQLTNDNDRDDSQPAAASDSAATDQQSGVPIGQPAETLEAGQYQQGQQRAKELDNIYEQAVDAVQPPTPNESTNPNDQIDETSSDREKLDTDSRLEDILNRLNSSDGWAGVIQQEESDAAVDSEDATQSEVVVENNFTDAEVEVVDQPEPSQDSVADVLSRMNIEENWNQEPGTQTEDDSTTATDLPNPESISPTPNPAEEKKEDVSVQDYMSELFGRLRGDEEAEEHLEPTETVQPITNVQPTLTAALRPEPVEVLPLTPAEYVPRQKAPTTNLRALREIANENARKAVSLSDRKRARLTRLLYLAMAVGCILTGCSILYLTQGNLKMMLVSFGVMAAAGYFGLQYFKSNKNEIRLLNKEKQNGQNDETESPQDLDVATSKDGQQIAAASIEPKE